MKFRKIDSVINVSQYIADVLIGKLESGQKVLWLVAGGSALKVVVEVSKLLAGKPLNKLHVALTDERYCNPDDIDSNWKQLLDLGFNLPGANLYPILKGDSIDKTTSYYDETLSKLINDCDYKIGLFGMGPDGHIGSLFPNHKVVEVKDHYAVWLKDSPKPPAQRMTMTPLAISKLDEALIYAVGEEKIPMLDNLEKDLNPSQQPAQLLKQLPKLTIFNDQKGELA